MHVPDGVVPLWLQLLLLAVSSFTLVLSAKIIRRKYSERLVPYIGVMAAVIFAAQLVNFPVPPASSGHLVGSTLLAVMLGPWAGILIMALVLFVQALYGDGGLLAYGLNLFNMGVFSCLFGWVLARGLFKMLGNFVNKERAVLFATAIASFVTTIVSAFLLGIELLTVQGFGITPLIVITSVHVIIAVGEAILTFVILLYFVRSRPELVSFLDSSKLHEMSNIPGMEDV
ncbi:MAG: energy-coupling factor ABC transporter permease [Candidatus Thorarchaeota archaeon]|nr:energy-coupling factor ABC transporter permease [Candidatus Thorarchaeota archaeon]